HTHLLSFPTRRSSDLETGGQSFVYLCLNHPGVTKEAEHFFFKKGIPVASSVAEWKSGAEKLTANWKNQSTIEIGGIPYVKPFSVDRKSTRLNSSHVSI